ncbi:ankyrin [Xylariaceae sp. AK1471]|nr:ankyrin [Xylariaceae sp. AK1471]
MSRLFGRRAKVPLDEPGWDNDAVVLARDDVSDFNEENILPQPPETLKKIRDWLQPTGYDDEGSEYKKHRDSHLAGTGGWLLESSVYPEWQASQKHGMLWIRGIPGSGKSVFAAGLISQLSQEAPVLHFFFRQIIDANHSPLTAVRDLIAQVLGFSPPLQSALKKNLEEGRTVDSLSTSDLWRHLRRALLYLPRAYVVVDALDEMDQNKDGEEFFALLAELADWAPSRIKVVVTSRPVPYVERHLRLVRTFDIWLEERMVDTDIATYVEHRLSESSIPKEQHGAIKAAVPGRANGLFLYAKLAMDRFLRPAAEVQRVLDELPLDLNVMYTDLLKEQSRRSGVSDERQLLILQWVTHASRPLRLLEIAEMINVTQYEADERDLKTAKDLVRSACGPLLEILPDETLCVVHHSLTEFLNGSTREVRTDADYPVIHFGATHNRLALICLKYLQSGVLDGILLVEERDPCRRVQPGWVTRGSNELPSPFVQYAASNWHVHARKAALSGIDQAEINEHLDKFLGVPETLERWALLEGIGRQGRVTPLFATAAVGLVDYVRVLLARPDTQINKGELAESLLCHAARKGYDDIVELLVQHGADIHETGLRGFTALCLAAEYGQPKVIRLLLSAGADPFEAIHVNNGCTSPSDWYYTTPVELACGAGHIDVVAEFITSCKGSAKRANILLYTAADKARPEVVRFLLDRLESFDINATNSRRETCLFAAGRNADPETIQLLLDAGADPNITYEGNGTRASSGDNVLFFLVKGLAMGYSSRRTENGNTPVEKFAECFGLLVKAGANVNQVDFRGNTLLHHLTNELVLFDDAAVVGVLGILLDASVDPNAANALGERLLDKCHNIELLRELLTHGAVDVNRRLANGSTALLMALKNGNVDLVELLIEHGADMSLVDEKGNGILHCLAVGSNTTSPARPELIQRLHEAGADVNLRNYKGQTPLHVLSADDIYKDTAAARGVIEALLKAGADLEAPDEQGLTPLLSHTCAPRHGASTDAIKLFAAVGARVVGVKDVKGRNALHLFCIDQLSDIKVGAPMLIELGLDPMETDYEGNTLWHMMAAKYSRYHWGKLPRTGPGKECALDEISKYGVDALQANYAGLTPLHILSSYRPAGLDSQSVPYSQGYTAFDHVLARAVEADRVNVQDGQGVTALHLASTFSDYNTRRLLESGANVSLATREGLTALHFAARSRQPNILGMLLESLRAQAGSDEEVWKVVNAEASGYLQQTALYFACASGVFESVRLLLEAGADAKHGYHSYLALDAVVKFEAEHKNWAQIINDREAGPHAGAVTAKIPDGKRPLVPSRTKDARGRDAERIDEILALLKEYGGYAAEDVDRAIDSAVSAGSDYAVDCLVRLRASLRNEENESQEVSVPRQLVLARRGRAANRDIVGHGTFYATTEKGPKKLVSAQMSHFERLMKLREYDLLADTLAGKDCLLVDQNGATVLHRLVEGGFASVLSKVATREHVRSLDDFAWCEKALKTYDVRQSSQILPLLHTAIMRERPNMDVVQLLVEKLGASVNIQLRRTEQQYGKGGRQKVVLKDKGVLHAIVHCNRWWQAALALPYLVEKAGADLEVRDAEGLTPLNAALACVGLLTFNRRAVETLVALGADVNAVDDKGVSCLARAQSDIDLVKLLIRHGAVVTPSAMIAAIGGGNAAVLEALLSGGSSPNVRKVEDKETETEVSSILYPPNRPHRPHNIRKVVREHEHMFPLHYAAVSYDRYRHQPAEPALFRDMIDILLRHGADPMARYDDDETIMHHIVAGNSFVRHFLALPDIDVEARDAHGQTLLLVAAQNYAENERDLSGGKMEGNKYTRTPLQMLNERGADPRARDKTGQSVLLHLLRGGGSSTDEIAYILEKAPDLIDEADVEGWTPLGRAMGRTTWKWRAEDYSRAHLLLDAGANPKTAGGPGGVSLLYLVSGGAWRCLEGEITGARKAIWDRLIGAGVDVNARDSEKGETAVFGYFGESPATQVGRVEVEANSSVDKGDAQLEEILFESVFDKAGVDWKTVNKKGESLLHVVAGNRGAAQDGKKAVGRFQYLLGKGLDPFAEDGMQRTALDIAALNGVREILSLFEKKGGNGEREVKMVVHNDDDFAEIDWDL